MPGTYFYIGVLLGHVKVNFFSPLVDQQIFDLRSDQDHGGKSDLRSDQIMI